MKIYRKPSILTIVPLQSIEFKIYFCLRVSMINIIDLLFLFMGRPGELSKAIRYLFAPLYITIIKVADIKMMIK